LGCMCHNITVVPWNWSMYLDYGTIDVRLFGKLIICFIFRQFHWFISTNVIIIIGRRLYTGLSSRRLSLGAVAATVAPCICPITWLDYENALYSSVERMHDPYKNVENFSWVIIIIFVWATVYETWAIFTLLPILSPLDNNSGATPLLRRKHCCPRSVCRRRFRDYLV